MRSGRSSEESTKKLPCDERLAHSGSKERLRVGLNPPVLRLGMLAYVSPAGLNQEISYLSSGLSPAAKQGPFHSLYSHST